MAEQKVPSRDELIVRQSQMERAIEIYTLIGEKPSIREICKLSKLLTEFIFTWNLNDDKLKKFDSNYKLLSREELNESLMNMIKVKLETGNKD